MNVRSRAAALGGTLLAIVAVAAVIAPWASPHDPLAIETNRRLTPPGAAHWFGTDDTGRDIFSRVLYGARISLFVGGLVVAAAVGMGAAAGLAATASPLGDRVLMRVMDGMMAFPGTLLAIAMMAVLGPRLANVIVALSLVFVPRVARVVRSAALVVRELDYVHAARALGARPSRILGRHVLPNCLAPVIVQATFIFAESVLAEAALSFLGVGLPPYVPSWGTILSGGRAFMERAPWITVFPGAAIIVTVLGLNLLGDGLRDLSDPRLRRAAIRR